MGLILQGDTVHSCVIKILLPIMTMSDPWLMNHGLNLACVIQALAWPRLLILREETIVWVYILRRAILC